MSSSHARGTITLRTCVPMWGTDWQGRGAYDHGASCIATTFANIIRYPRATWSRPSAYSSYNMRADNMPAVPARQSPCAITSITRTVRPPRGIPIFVPYAEVYSSSRREDLQARKRAADTLVCFGSTFLLMPRKRELRIGSLPPRNGAHPVFSRKPFQQT